MKCENRQKETIPRANDEPTAKQEKGPIARLAEKTNETPTPSIINAPGRVWRGGRRVHTHTHTRLYPCISSSSKRVHGAEPLSPRSPRLILGTNVKRCCCCCPCKSPTTPPHAENPQDNNSHQKSASHFAKLSSRGPGWGGGRGQAHLTPRSPTSHRRFRKQNLHAERETERERRETRRSRRHDARLSLSLAAAIITNHIFLPESFSSLEMMCLPNVYLFSCAACALISMMIVCRCSWSATSMIF